MTEKVDEIRDYLNTIGQIPLLKANEEIELGKQVKRMRTCWEIRETLLEENPLVTEEEWAEKLGISVRELQGILKRGKRAKDKMVNANLRLVVAMSKKYQGKGLELLDLVQEGNLGLIRAVEKFEVEKGYKFSTYAYHWIRQALVRAIFDRGRTIRLPAHINEEIHKLKKVQLEIRQKYGRSATTEEVSERLEVTPQKVRLLREIQNPILSLDQKILGEEENSTLLSFIPDKKGNLGEFLENLGNKELVEQSLCILKPKEQRVLKEYYLGTSSLTLSEIAKNMNVSRERVRQIKKKALEKLNKVICLALNEKSHMVSVEVESKKSQKFKDILNKSLKEVESPDEVKISSEDVDRKSEEKMEKTTKEINSINPFPESLKIKEQVNFPRPMFAEKSPVKVADVSPKIKGSIEASSTTVSSKTISNSEEKLSKTKTKVENKKKDTQSKVKKKLSTKSKPKTKLCKSQQIEIKKQLQQLSYIK
ncbi:sigma-70 family RNA polymerase sigma factor [Crocosphaera sp.]|uniref:sigma-70 family RNA polymerase sigma factor n=1 Tax=Crocosphaera sp. TaxID=2729996 RepID=UPI00257EF7DA|nr:sigma-70 family RNA polymerase sigma factor [Crocosphaera sp.]NQZ65474.1 sigma-70 family RNA polymerase sigma factor [Crocosphaera sp.]